MEKAKNPSVRLFRDGDTWYRVINGEVVVAEDITKKMQQLKRGRK